MNYKEIARIIVGALEKTTLTSGQKIEVITGILESMSSSVLEDKRYKLNDILDLFSGMVIPPATSSEKRPAFLGSYDEYYLGIFFKDNSFTIAKASGGEFIKGPHPSYSKYTWSLKDVVTGVTIDDVNFNSSASSKPSWISWERGQSLTKSREPFYFIRINTLLSRSKNSLRENAYIDLEYLEKIINIINKYLGENPLFTEQVFLGRKH